MGKEIHKEIEVGKRREEDGSGRAWKEQRKRGRERR